MGGKDTGESDASKYIFLYSFEFWNHVSLLDIQKLNQHYNTEEILMKVIALIHRAT